MKLKKFFQIIVKGIDISNYGIKNSKKEIRKFLIKADLKKVKI